jgi:hypothetical protein
MKSISIKMQVTEVYKKDIIHRDLKLDNIKFTLEERIKVLIFSFARPFVSKDKIIEIMCVNYTVSLVC